MFKGKENEEKGSATVMFLLLQQQITPPSCGTCYPATTAPTSEVVVPLREDGIGLHDRISLRRRRGCAARRQLTIYMVVLPPTWPERVLC